MADPDKSIFISYRRALSHFEARCVWEELRHSYSVFMDVESIDNGAFEEIILDEIAARAHFLVVLVPGALDRCKNENDWFRREIERAIQLERNIVPLLIGNFRFEDHASRLPKTLEKLKTFNGIPVYPEYFA